MTNPNTETEWQDIPTEILSKAKAIYEGSWPDPVTAIAEALMEANTGIGTAHDLISDWLGEGTGDLPDDTVVKVNIGGRCIINDKLGELRAAINQNREIASW